MTVKEGMPSIGNAKSARLARSARSVRRYTFDFEMNSPKGKKIRSKRITGSFMYNGDVRASTHRYQPRWRIFLKCADGLYGVFKNDRSNPCPATRIAFEVATTQWKGLASLWRYPTDVRHGTSSPATARILAASGLTRHRRHPGAGGGSRQVEASPRQRIWTPACAGVTELFGDASSTCVQVKCSGSCDGSRIMPPPRPSPLPWLPPLRRPTQACTGRSRCRGHWRWRRDRCGHCRHRCRRPGSAACRAA